MDHQRYLGSKPNALLLLADGKVFSGFGIGAFGQTIGEICFNTGMTGYQEVLTDPSYAGQIITFTFPHIGNVGTNEQDIESIVPAARGLVLREKITPASNFRDQENLDVWLKRNNITGICGIDTRALTRYIRENGAQNALIFYAENGNIPNVDELRERLVQFPSLDGLELAQTVMTAEKYAWEDDFSLSPLFLEKMGERVGVREAAPNNELIAVGTLPSPQPSPRGRGSFHVVALDFGAKLNILRSLTSVGGKVTVLPGNSSAEEILAENPDGIFLSNGPGDPAATGKYALPVLKKLIEKNLPIFGICLGHQLLALACGAKTIKMHQGHRGANHPVKNLKTGQVEITSQNHGFVVDFDSLPADIEATHISLFDNSIEGFRHKTKPLFAVQYHPESSPGPHDSRYLFDDFVKMMKNHDTRK